MPGISMLPFVVALIPRLDLGLMYETNTRRDGMGEGLQRGSLARKRRTAAKRDYNYDRSSKRSPQ